MLTLITGTPGAGKSLYSVWELARKVPGSTVESNGNAMPRRLLSNVKDLLLDHQHITAEDLNTWHEWAQPGDVILFDEVQEVWRPRGLGTKVPECIAALETHRHRGVDIILVTQHPMLVDPNIRRLVNQHIHMRRIAKAWAWVYEWDHCSNISTLKTAMQSRIWKHPKAAYALYKSAQVHTKPTARVPRIAIIGVLALVGFAYAGQLAYKRITGSLGGESVSASSKGPASAPPAAVVSAPVAVASVPVAMASAPGPVDAPVYLGCIANADGCRCYSEDGAVVPMEPAMCRETANAPMRLAVGGSRGAALAAPVPPAPQAPEAAHEAAASGQSAVMPGAGYGLAARPAGRAP